MSDITQILKSLEKGDGHATDELLSLVYDELRRLAASRLAQEAAGQTIQPTELVHEAYLRLVGAATPQTWEGRRHFFGAAAEAMRRILIDRARRKQRLKRGGGWERVDLDSIQLSSGMADGELLALNEALEQLAELDPPSAELVKLRFFVGLTQGEAAELLGVSRRTADNIWAFARAWLYKTVREN